jgi:hypoxanthine phosphoribosyltransferase
VDRETNGFDLTSAGAAPMLLVPGGRKDYMDSKLPEVLISETDIRRRVGELAEQISADYADKSELVLLGVLKGSFIFLADLSRAMTIPRTIEFIAVSSYEHGSVPSGAVTT